MKRELPFFSPISILAAVLLFSGLGYSVWKFGGLGFSPGPVSASANSKAALQQFSSHAGFEQDCTRCHQPLSSDQASLCLACHADIASQREAKTGTHGWIDPSLACSTCHPEHRGRSFDPVAYAVDRFDHHQTRLPLSGAHAALECSACHQAGDFTLAYQECRSCHSEPSIHAGMYPPACEDCHTDLSWKPALVDNRPFDHEQAGFSLAVHTRLGGSQPVICGNCHTSAGGRADLDSCAACHGQLNQSFMDDHLATMGPDCLQCHDGSDRMAAFNHDAVFALDGTHASLNCAECHPGFHFQGTSANCSACHAEPEIHAGYFGPQCHACHNTGAWTPAKLVAHTFLLDHGGLEANACQSCHPESYPAYTCTACHEHPPAETAARHQELGVQEPDISLCARCHPTGQAGDAEELHPAGGAQ